MNARSALFDLYGDHLRGRDGQAPVAALVRLLAPLEIAAPAVRTAVSRMVRQGWLEPVRLPEGPGYALTGRAARRLDDAAARIYRTSDAGWDGRWRLVVAHLPRERSRRDRVRAGLAFLGYAQLDDATWIGPHGSEEVDQLLDAEGVPAERFDAAHDGDTARLVRRAWDTDALGAAYQRWTDEARHLLHVLPGGVADSDEQAFAVRSRLVHEWRKFLFLDPGLPRELLPERWPGDEAAALFDAESSRLAPGAARFVDECLTPAYAAAGAARGPR